LATVCSVGVSDPLLTYESHIRKLYVIEEIGYTFSEFLE